MSEEKRVLKKRIILNILSLLCLMFIFSQSLMPAKTSGAESGKIVDFLNSLFESLGINITFTGHFVRKCAHFCEFAVLGFLLYYTLNANLSKRKTATMLVPVCYIATAVSDECLQLISRGRACSVNDMILDSFGATFGFALAVLLYYAIIKNRKSRKYKGVS